jgi:hypothetical protein
MTPDFLDRLDGWLLQQPEAPFLLSPNRATRRRAARLLARHLFTLPLRQQSGGLNRPTRRKVQRQARRAMGELRARMSARAQRLENKARRDRRRFDMHREERVAFIETDQVARVERD